VIAILVILVSSDSFEESIPTILPTFLPNVPPSPDHTPALPDITPASPDYLPASPDYTPASLNYSFASDIESDPSEDPSSAIYHHYQLSHHFYHRLMTPQIVIQPPSLPMPIPYRRPYRYHPNGTLHMLTVKKRVGRLPTHRLVVRHSIDHSSSYYSFPNDSARDSSSDSSSEASPSRKRRRSPMTSVSALSPVFGALSPVRADLIPSPKRVKDSDYLANIKVDSRESSKPSRSRGTDVGVDDDIERVDESHSEHEIDLVQTT
nr:hypothetical protein [Tanacetum cinerariifolium]